LGSDPERRDADRWQARLALAFAHRDGRTRLASRDHAGPLVVQKPFHPEGDAVCQVVIVHPPGGIAGGDDLALTLDVAPRAHAQITLPAATKWYRSAGGTAVQTVEATLADDSVLEYLPQGAIVFDGARADSTLRFNVARGARLIAWELACLGRHAARERFSTGRWRQRFEIVREHALIWSERIDLVGGSRLLDAPAGLNGNAVFGTFVAMSPTLDDTALADARTVAPAAGEGAVTRLPEVLVARWRGPASDAGQRYFAALWSALRPRLVGRDAVVPRIWST
jgi:urease accessory protein